MKFIVAGSWRFPIYEAAFAQALALLGHDVTRFAWEDDFDSAVGQWERRMGWVGPASRRMHVKLAEAAVARATEVILLWRGVNLKPANLNRLRTRTHAILASYINDDPFAWQTVPVPWQYRRLWRHFIDTIPLYDVNFVYRERNLEDYKRAGSRHTALLMSYFVPWLHAPPALIPARFRCDVAFIGHGEDDGRIECLRALFRAGIDVRLYGDASWTRAMVRRVSPGFVNYGRVDGEDYPLAIAGARIALCFLSRWNRDTYTRRCFEIPACGGLLLSERTPLLESLFQEWQHAVFFDDATSLLLKVRTLLANPNVAARIRHDGYRRVTTDGHDVVSRAREMVHIVAPLLESRRTLT